MSLSAAGTGVAITNPLVLYRALVATNRITPDPAQHRLDYEPTVEYSHRLKQISKAVGSPDKQEDDIPSSLGQRGIWQSLLAQKEKRDSLALTRTMTSHEAALNLDSPKGLMLHGEVGIGKSMLIDLFADCLPNRKKARWHFNTFILETFAKLEQLRRDRLSRIPPSINGPDVDDYSLLWLARDLINTSPILFLDEFQLPDRASSKIMTNLMTSFFQLGGVLIATSNRMPEELHKAAGMTFAPPPSRMDSLTLKFGLGGRSGRSDSMFSGQSEFAGFLDVLKARCEVWEMQGGKDYRRQEVDFQPPPQESAISEDLWHLDEHQDLQRVSGMTATGSTVTPETAAAIANELSKTTSVPETTIPPKAPKNYLIKPTEDASPEDIEAYNQQSAALTSIIPNDWTPSTMRVYGRNVLLPRTSQSTGTALFSFAELCGTTAFGPADYISLASTYHTLILTTIPVLSLLQKNEARRFITLLDALYEAKCKLLILDAAAGPDDLFFPAKKNSRETDQDGDGGVYAETFSEAYQDVVAPFRPNISSSTPDFAEEATPEPDYTHSRFEGMLAPDSLEDGPPNRIRRNAQSGREKGPIDPDDDILILSALLRAGLGGLDGQGRGRGRGRGRGPNFNKATAFTGSDEKFAFKRARSRIWEMCSHKWWARSEEGWHRPLPASLRRWESSPAETYARVYMADSGVVVGDRNETVLEGLSGEGMAGAGLPSGLEGMGASANVDEISAEPLFRKGSVHARKAAAEGRAGEASMGRAGQAPTGRDGEAPTGFSSSPYRTATEPPPTFSWTHIWGTMKWGKKAGAWGQGVEGLEERKRERRGKGEKDGKGAGDGEGNGQGKAKGNGEGEGKKKMKSNRR
ncbi:AFG1-like ATPase-domain-containing protein [Delphinella strobiligena]|nr:AFG1-like ATPase-domain-containing protein [Delphinella strobiligena]